jgi:S-layer homology domain
MASMKKSLFVLSAALSFGFAAAQTAPAAQVPTLTDVPAGHWAKDAIDKIVAQGIILGYPDGTYRGTQNLTRYEAAVIIARLLDQIGSGGATVTDPATLTSLQNAVQELSADLAALGVRVSDLEANSVSQEDFARLEARVEELGAGGGDPAAVEALTQQIADANARVDDLQANYDALRADVDDNASSIAALNDLTVLLNNDILGLQDRVSAVETAQTDFTTRLDGVDATITKLDNRVQQLEKYAFSIKPTLSATYYVGRGNRNFDIDKLIPGTMFSTGTDSNDDTKDTPLDGADLTGDRVALLAPTADNLFGFASDTYTVFFTDGTRAAYAGVPSAFVAPTGKTVAVIRPAAVNIEGQTKIDFGITFGNGTGVSSAPSDVTGALVPSKGGLNVNKLDITFGIRAGYPSDTFSAGPDGKFGTPDDVSAATNYPDLYNKDANTTYQPLFFYFKNASLNFTVGAAPVIVTFGKGQKFKFSDYILDNDKTARGDGYTVAIDGSPLPVIGAFKPMINVVYGSKGGADGDNKYYRGIRFEVTPVGTLKAGIQVAQEGVDTFGALAGGLPTDVTVFGADLHGTIAGFQFDSETAKSTVANGATKEGPFASYVKVSGEVGPVKLYDLNFRAVSNTYDKVAGIMEADPDDGDNGSTAPYGKDQIGFGVKVGGTLGPVSLGAYYDLQTKWATPGATAGTNASFGATNPSVKISRGAAAKVSLFSLVTVRGGFYEFIAGPAAALDPAVAVGGTGSALRYNVRADVTPGFGLNIGAYLRRISLSGIGLAQDDKNADGNGYFTNSKYSSAFGLKDNAFTDQSGCGDQHPGVAGSDTDGVGGSLTAGLSDGTDKACYTEYGVELGHDGASDNALVKGLSFRVGFANLYRNAGTYYAPKFYGDAAYGTKFGAFKVDAEAAFASVNYNQTNEGTKADTTKAAFGIKIVSDPLDIFLKPAVEAQVGYYTGSYAGLTVTTDNYKASGLKYLVGVKFQDFLLPNTKLAVYYAGYNAVNRSYTPSTLVADFNAGKFADANNGATTNQTGLYTEVNYYDLAFAYGIWSLSQKVGGVEKAANDPVTQAPIVARGQTFKISYKVKF